MRRAKRALVGVTVVLLLMPLGVPASAGHDGDPRTKNLHPMGHIQEPRSLIDPDADNHNIHTDIAFWGKYAFQGNWDGFTIRDVSAPGNPKTISHTSCDGNQGDVVVWDDVLVRSWNTPAGTPGPFGAGLTCDGEDVAPGFEGLHVFDISDLENPVLMAQVATECGSHTATGVPDVENGRLLVYNSPSDGDCPGIDIVEVPLADPASSSVLGFASAGRGCHDTGVILGDAMMAGCAGGDGFTVWTLDPADGASLESPMVIQSVTVPGIGIGHSAAFTWDGDVLIFGHEPGGGVDAACEESDPESDRTFFFYDPRTGDPLGEWTLTRTQSAIENCTLHNYNIVPVSDRYVLVHGSYQSGTAVLDFTDLAEPVEVAWSDPPPIPVVPEIEIAPGTFIPNPFCGGLGCEIGGAWSSYWYDGFIYETNITEGLNVFRFSGRQTAGALKLGHLNPQTQEFTL
ncbi:MAG TPA: hypothetical protein VF129_00145 [Actinomycetota bacterium]